MGNSNGIMNESPIPLYYQIYVDLKNKLLINKLVDENGKLCGDVDYDTIQDKAQAATPVPGGVGAVTTAVLAKHLVRAAGL